MYAIAGDGVNARRYATTALATAEDNDLGAFFVAYAHEALARAAALGGDSDGASSHLHEARRLAAEVGDPDDRKMLEADLEDIL